MIITRKIIFELKKSIIRKYECFDILPNEQYGVCTCASFILETRFVETLKDFILHTVLDTIKHHYRKVNVL